MNVFKTLLLFAVCTISLSACASKPKTDKTQNDMKSVIVYFTHSGNTELAAKELADVIGSKAIRLLPQQPYTKEDVDWTDRQSRCTREHLDQTLRPAIKPIDIAWKEIDTVFIGFPIWWHEEPAVIRTFLDEYRQQLSGKVLYPFCTSYESPMSEADTNLRKGYPEFNWKTGLRLPSEPDQIRRWIEQK